MALPTQDWDGVQLRWRGVIFTGAPAEGSLTFTPTETRFLDNDPTQSVTIFGRSVSQPIVNGLCTITVPATDDPDIIPTGFQYQVQENITGGGGATYFIEVPISAKSSGLDLNRLLPVTPTASQGVSLVTRSEFDSLVASVEAGGGGSGSFELDALTDVSAPNPNVGDRLAWNGTAWVNSAAAANTDAAALTGIYSIERMPPGGLVVVDKAKAFYGAAGSWPSARPTSNTSIVVLWLGDTDPGAIAIAGDIIDLMG